MLATLRQRNFALLWTGGLISLAGDRMLQVISALIQEGIAAGEIRPGNVNDMVWAALACMSIAIEEQLCHCNPRLDRAAMTRMLDIVFDGLTVR